VIGGIVAGGSAEAVRSIRGGGWWC
jgi:hypothetical protein